MSDCESLREQLQLTKAARNLAMVDNAKAENEGRRPPYDPDEITELRRQVHEAARRCREAGCDIEDLVGRYVEGGHNVGEGDFPG